MILFMFPAPAVDLREVETKGEASRSAVAAELTGPAFDAKRLGEQIRSRIPGGSAWHAALRGQFCGSVASGGLCFKLCFRKKLTCFS